MEYHLNYLLAVVIKTTWLLDMVSGQLTMEKLQDFRIDPLNLNGTEPYTDLTIDQIIMRASGGPGMAQNLILSDDGTVLAELDMRLTQDQFYNLYEQPSNFRSSTGRKKREAINTRNKRKAIRDTILRWKDAVVPYSFVTGHFDDKERYMMRSAMTEWEKYTCLRFRPSNYGDGNAVRFQNGVGCNSQLGMVGGHQPLNLDKNGCRFKGLYLHEIGHAVGLVHEHQLPNRDHFIEILYHNVEPNMRIWFNKYSSQEVDQMRVPYEYSSVMHYGITAFSMDGKSQTIRAKQTDMEKTIGRVYRKELSFTDVKIINLMYNCSSECDSSIICNDEGYVDQNCKCICKDGTDSCTKNKIEPDTSCLNAMDNWQCSVWANQGECTRNPRFMLESCRKACHLCEGDKEKTDGPHIALWTWQWLCRFANICPKNWTVDTCKDQFPTTKCQVWKDRGECIVNKEWMTKNCKHTCKACSDDSSTNPEVNCNNKHADEAECEKWASEGECKINMIWMPANCRKACHMCNQEDNHVYTTTPPPEPQDCENLHNTVECDNWAGAGECDVNPDWMIPNCRMSCKKCEEDGGSAECKNTWDDQQCEGWARDQECLKNSVWMLNHCYKACSKCTTDEMTTKKGSVTVVTTPKPSDVTTKGACVNNHRSDKECKTWAKYGHCDINPWMKIHCAKACSTCISEEETTQKPVITTLKPNKNTTPKSNGGGTCFDEQQHCPAWAAHGFCKDNPSTALRICKKSCEACTEGNNVCKDNHQLCPVWSRGGQCQRNSGYMLRNCQKSCNVC